MNLLPLLRAVRPDGARRRTGVKLCGSTHACGTRLPALSHVRKRRAAAVSVLPAAARCAVCCASTTARTSPISSSPTQEAHHARIAWYQKQLLTEQLSSRDLPLLFAKLANKDQGWQLVCASALADTSVPVSHSTLDGASTLTAAAKLCALSYLVDTARSRDGARLASLLHRLIDGAVTTSTVSTRQLRERLFNVCHCAIRDQVAKANTCALNAAHVECLVRSVLILPPGELTNCVNADGESLDRCVIHLAEHYLSDTDLSRLYVDCGGLHFEVAAYCSDGRAVVEPPRTPSGKGFGDAVCALLSPTRSTPIHPAAVAALRMPPRLGRYTRTLLALSTARRLREEKATHVDFDAPLPSFLYGHTPPVVGDHVDAERDGTRRHLECISDIHFRYRCGTAHTAKALLGCCTTRGQLLALMAYTSGAGLHVSFDAAGKLLKIRQSDSLFVSIRLGGTAHREDHRQRCGGNNGSGSGETALAPLFVFEATRDPLTVGRSRESDDHPHQRTTAAAGARDTTGGRSDELLALGALWRAARAADLLPPTQNPLRRAGNRASSEDALSSIAESHIGGLLAGVPHLRASHVSSWGALLVRRGNLPAARALFSSAALRHIAPDMETIVNFIEAHHRRDPATVREAAHFVEDHFPDVAPHAFRAFMERLSRTAGGRLDPVTALQLLLYATDNELRHLPPDCLRAVASGRRGADIRALLKVLSVRPPSPSRWDESERHTHPYARVPQLCLSALGRLVETVEEMGLRPTVDFFSVSKSSRDVLWWSSVDAAGQKCATQRLYETCAWPLWRLAAESLDWDQLREPRLAAKAIRLACLGCDDAPRVVSTLDSGLDWIAPREGEPRQASPREEAALLSSTLFCASEVLCAMGARDLALTLLPADTLDSPAAVRLARQRAQRCAHAGSAATCEGKQHVTQRRPSQRFPLRRSGMPRRGRSRRRFAAHSQSRLSSLGFSRPFQKLISTSVYSAWFCH